MTRGSRTRRDHVHHLDGHPCPGDVRKHPLEDLALLQAIEEGIHASDGDYEVGPTELHGDSVEHFRIVVEPEN